jgi:predicted CxxxxCH...CXXCH cytochrome family protein
VPVRQFPGSLSHIDGGPVTISFSGLATQGVGASAGYSGNGGSCAVYCHGSGTAFANPGSTSANVSPSWTATSIACNGCHGTPPTTGQHGFANHQFPCGYCHAQVAGTGSTPAITNKALHVNGTKNVGFTVSGDPYDAANHSCTNIACHGGTGTRSWY